MALVLSEEQKAEIIQLAKAPVSMRAVWRLAEKWGCDRRFVARRIQRAGGTMIPVWRRWTRAEDRILQDNPDIAPRRLVVELKEAGFHRGQRSVYARLFELGLHGYYDPTGHSSRELARLLGVGGDWARRRIKAGTLSATRAEILCGKLGRNGSTGKWAITPRSLRKYFKANPAELAKVRKTANRTWLADIMGEIRADAATERAAPYNPAAGGLAEHVLWEAA